MGCESVGSGGTNKPKVNRGPFWEPRIQQNPSPFSENSEHFRTGSMIRGPLPWLVRPVRTTNAMGHAEAPQGHRALLGCQVLRKLLEDYKANVKLLTKEGREFQGRGNSPVVDTHVYQHMGRPKMGFGFPFGLLSDQNTCPSRHVQPAAHIEEMFSGARKV